MKYFWPGNDPNQHVCWKCKDEKTQDLRHGYTNLTAHLNGCRPSWKEDLLTDLTIERIFTFNEKSRIIFEWLKQVAM